MSTPIVVVGAGGFGREVLDVVVAVNAAGGDQWKILGVVDDSPSDLNRDRLDALGVQYLGGLDALAGLPIDANVAVGVGSPQARQEIVARLDAWGLTSPSLLHPTAVVGSNVEIGAGMIACAHASIGTNVRLGRHVHLNPHAVIGHDAVLQDFVSINPNATISGECEIGTGALVGAAAVVLQGVSVGSNSVLGAAACLVEDAAANDTLVGVPARPLVRGPA